MCPSAPRVCSEPGGQKPVLSLLLDLVRWLSMWSDIDLHAVDDRYHRKCGKSFHAIPASKCNSYINSGPECVENNAISSTRGALVNDRVRIRSSLDVKSIYNSNCRHVLSWRTLLKKVIGHFDDDIFTLQSPGIASVLVLKTRAPQYLKLVYDDMDDLHLSLQKIVNG